MYDDDDDDEPTSAPTSAPAPAPAVFCQRLFILLISSTGYTLTVESSPAGSTALVPLGDPD